MLQPDLVLQLGVLRHHLGLEERSGLHVPHRGRPGLVSR